MSDRKNELIIGRTSKVLENSPADPSAANNYFRSQLSFETDPSDVSGRLFSHGVGDRELAGQSAATYPGKGSVNSPTYRRAR